MSKGTVTARRLSASRIIGLTRDYRLTRNRTHATIVAALAAPASLQLISQALCSPCRKSKTQRQQGSHNNVKNHRAVAAVVVLGGALVGFASGAAAQTVPLPPARPPIDAPTDRGV